MDDNKLYYVCMTSILVCTLVLCPFIGVFLGIVVGIFVGLGITGIIVVIIDAIKKSSEKKKEKKVFSQNHPHLKAERFYEACANAGIRSSKSANDFLKIKELAKTHGLRMKDDKLLEFYQLGKSECERIKREEEAAYIAKQTAEEREYEQWVMRFANLPPHNKIKMMCLEKAEEKREEEKYIDAHAMDGYEISDKLYDFSKRKEYDWATRAGIANGIGGLGAGIAVAIDTEIKNAEIRRENEELRNATYAVGDIVWRRSIDQSIFVQKQIERYENGAQNAHKLKVEKPSQMDLLKMLSPTVVKQTQNKTGSLVIKVKIGKYHALKIGKNNAMIDGTIKAVFWRGNKRVGEAVLTMPLDNNGYSEEILEGICRSDSLKYGEYYRVTFEPRSLWIIEQLHYCLK